MPAATGRRSVDNRYLTFFEQRIWEQVLAAAFVKLATTKAPTKGRTMPINYFYQVVGDNRSQLVEHAELIADEAIRGMRELEEVRNTPTLNVKSA